MGSNTSLNTARARWFPWAVAALTAVGAAIRFSTLGLQSYRHDEAVTAGRVLLDSLSGTMHQVWAGESTPPLYYLLAWAWSHVFGVHEVGLRSLSAMLGVATVPVAYLIGRELVGRRTGLALAAIVAVDPMLVWYSQDARSYALLVLLSAAALLFFLRARRGGARDLAWWAVFSALALATHYFALFPLAIEAGWLVLRSCFRLRDEEKHDRNASGVERRRVLLAVGFVVAAGALLAPIALHQAQGKNNDWIASFGLLGRLERTGTGFFVTETGLLKHALIPLALYAAAVALLLLRGGTREKRGAAVAAVVGGGAVALALVSAAVGQDFVLDRNLLPALIPLAAIGAAGVAAPRAGRLGVGVGAALVVYLLAFCVYADFRPALQRDDWRSVADAIGAPRRSRAILVWEQGDEPLAFYIGAGEVRVKRKQWRRAPVPVSEVDVVSGRPPPPRHDVLPPGFTQVERVTVGRMTLIRYRSAWRRTLGWGAIVGNFTGYSNNAVLLDAPSR